MFSALVMPSASDCVANKPVPAFYRRAEAMDIPRFPTIGDVGTGGLNTGSYYQSKSGYKTVEVVQLVQEAAVAALPPFASLMWDIQAGFGRTMSRLPEAFGVSRQTLYNWLSGEKTPKEQHHAKLHELAAASKVFQAAGFKPNSATLDKTVANGKSLLELISEGSNGADAANRLLRIVNRGSDARAKLDDILGDRKPSRLSASDMGAPHLDERS
jgi:hypothetical protein